MKETKVPKHIAIIMDGNGRWAKKKLLPKIEGHRQGTKSVERAIEGCIDLGVKVLTLYAFSTENWRRSEGEVKGLLKLLGLYLGRNFHKLVENEVKMVVSGDVGALSSTLQKQLSDAMEKTQHHKKLILNLAINYGSREELIRAIKAISEKVKVNNISVDEINEALIASHLYTKDLPEPDLLIRTSGEKRLSNFLLWQLSYTELYFTDILWPDFTAKDLKDAVGVFQKRCRRYGA